MVQRSSDLTFWKRQGAWERQLGTIWYTSYPKTLNTFNLYLGLATPPVLTIAASMSADPCRVRLI